MVATGVPLRLLSRDGLLWLALVEGGEQAARLFRAALHPHGEFTGVDGGARLLLGAPRRRGGRARVGRGTRSTSAETGPLW